MKSTNKTIKKAIAIILSTIIAFYASPKTIYAEAYEKQYCSATIEDNFTDNEIIIVTMPSSNYYDYNNSSFSEVGCIEIKELTSKIEPNTLSRIIKLTIAEKSKQAVLNAIQILEKRPDIYSAEPNYIGSFEASASDTYYETDQWNLGKISLSQAWDIELPSSTTTVKVGVIDSGIQGDHPDLEDNININLSKSFLSFYADPLVDLVGHGTAVAGIIGAATNNDTGIAGIAPNVELVSLRVTYNSSTYNFDNVLDAIAYASNSNTFIPILNMSSGTLIEQLSSSNIAYMRIALNNYDGLFVCSAGNSGLNTNIYHHYPSDDNYLTNVISVGASTNSDQRYEFSNYGITKVDLFAPGYDIFTTYPENLHISGYMYLSGTSLSTPHVTGVAAYMLSVNSNLSSQEIKDIIVRNVDEISYLYDQCVSGGRLNAYKCVYASLKRGGNDPVQYTAYSTTAHTITYNDCGECIDCADINNRENCSGCEACGSSCWVSFTELHNFQDSIVEDADHTIYCTDCNYSITASHTLYVSDIDDDAESVTIGCLGCSLSYVCKGYQYSNLNSTTHILYCNTDCAYRIIEEHFYEFTAHSSTYHTETCQHCSETHLKEHHFAQTANGRQCVLCGYTY